MQILSLLERNLSKSLKKTVQPWKNFTVCNNRRTQTSGPSPALIELFQGYWHSMPWCTHLLIGLQSLYFFNYCADFTYTFNTTYAKRTGNTWTAKFLRAALLLSRPSCGTHQPVSSALHLNPCKAETAFRQQPITGNLGVLLPRVRQNPLKTISEWKQSTKHPQFCIWSTLLLFKINFSCISVINTNLSWILSFLLAKMHSQSS